MVMRTMVLRSLGAAIAIATPLITLQPGAIAQSLSDCQPPDDGEYLLLVVNDSDATESQLRQTLPPSAEITRCQYLEQDVTRVGGFTEQDTANTWAQYLTDIGGLDVVVARPSTAVGVVDELPSSSTPPTPEIEADESPTVPEPTAPEPTASEPTAPEPTTESSGLSAADFPMLPPGSPSPAPNVPASPAPSQGADTPATAEPALGIAGLGYRPQALGRGYAVLVDYSNDPNVAIALQETLGASVGLVAYQQRPYLLATLTSDAAIAVSVLQRAGDAGFTTMVVNGQTVILLTPRVALTP
ncbi:MAG: hypothetical protein EA367_03580 [Leptolyngbya sp. DLM2.Bin15]|nr:MAG: hypothetical protein EA367_03580 [Leptolyngbya sp. DLM2.Bin15]